MNLYKEWAFQLFPTYAFEDVLNSTIKLGSKPAVRNYLHSLRNEECQRYMVRRGVTLVLHFIPFIRENIVIYLAGNARHCRRTSYVS